MSIHTLHKGTSVRSCTDIGGGAFLRAPAVMAILKPQRVIVGFGGLDLRSISGGVSKRLQRIVRQTDKSERPIARIVPFTATASTGGNGGDGGSSIPDSKLTADDREPEGSSAADLDIVLAKVGSPLISSPHPNISSSASGARQ